MLFPNSSGNKAAANFRLMISRTFYGTWNNRDCSGPAEIWTASCPDRSHQGCHQHANASGGKARFCNCRLPATASSSTTAALDWHPCKLRASDKSENSESFQVTRPQIKKICKIWMRAAGNFSFQWIYQSNLEGPGERCSAAWLPPPPARPLAPFSKIGQSRKTWHEHAKFTVTHGQTREGTQSDCFNNSLCLRDSKALSSGRDF